MLQVRRGVCQKRVSMRADRAERNIPCSLEEVVLNSPQKIFTYLVWAEIMDITKAVKMRKVIGFVKHFFPIGLLVGASRPLGDAALDLMNNVHNPSKKIPGKELAKIRSHHSENKGDSCKWDG